jgi:hypothetical protein
MGMQAPPREQFDRFVLTALQASRTYRATVSLGSSNQLLRGEARFCCDGLPTAGLGQDENTGSVQWQ